MNNYAELRAALDDGSFDFDQIAYINDVRALLAERDALAEAVDCLHAFAGKVAPSASFWDETWPKLDAAIARAALSQEQGGSDAQG